MIDQLRVGKAAHFYVLKRPLTKAAISDLFRGLRARESKPSPDLFRYNRVEVGDARWSAISFLYDTQPSFFSNDADVVERVCGFLLIVEHRDHVAVFKSRLDIPASFATRHFVRIASERVDVAVASGEAVFEKIRLRNMSLSKLVMRSKTLEADDLRNAIGPAGSSRYVPRGYDVRSGADRYSTTPSTGRISKQSDRVGHLFLIEYATNVIDALLDAVGGPPPFISTFARSIDLSTTEGARLPTSFAVDIAGLQDAVFETSEIRLVRQGEEEHEEISHAEWHALTVELGEVFQVGGEGRVRQICRAADDAIVGSLALNKSRIALSKLELPLLDRIEVEKTIYPVGEDPDRVTLRRYIDRSDLFIVLFEDISLAYIDGGLFRDAGIIAGGLEFIRYLRAEPLLANVASEKGLNFTEAQTSFDDTSTFGVVVDSVSEGDEVLVCDDLGNEWADFVGISNASSPPRISFYHAKYGGLSIGATPFHESVSQAIKNLGNMSFPQLAMPDKIQLWSQHYISGNGVETSISRTLRTAGAGLTQQFNEIRLAPDAIRRVFIVTSSLSLRAVQTALAGIAEGNRPNPYFVQLYWLLMSYFSACAEMNAHGYVVCRP